MCSTACTWRPVSTSAVSVSPWTSTQAGPNPSFTSFKLLIFSQTQILITVITPLTGSKRDGTLNSSCPSIFTLEWWRWCICAGSLTVHSMAAQITGSNNHSEASELGDRASNEVFFYTSSACKVCFWIPNTSVRLRSLFRSTDKS